MVLSVGTPYMALGRQIIFHPPLTHIHTGCPCHSGAVSGDGAHDACIQNATILDPIIKSREISGTSIFKH